MANWTMGLAIYVVGALLMAVSAIAISDGPFIIAHKKASITKLRTGSERITVSVDVYNEGSATAYDVSLNDNTWSSDLFNVVTGNTSITWENLDVGSVLSHSFELEAKVKTVFYGSPATITFRIPTSSALQVAYSTPIFPLEILADRIPEKKFDLAKRLLVKYGSLVSVTTLVVLFIYLVATPSSNSSKGSKKKR